MENLNNIDKTSENELRISDVRSSIQNRIQKHNEAISLFQETVVINIKDTTLVKQYTDLIRSEEIAIRECEMILEYCF